MSRLTQSPAPAVQPGSIHRRISALLLTTLVAGMPFTLLAADPPPPAKDGTVRVLLKPAREAALASPMDGQIVEMSLEEGDRFRVGDALAVFDCRSRQADLKQADAVLESRMKTYETNSKLGAYKSIGEVEVATAAAEARRAEAEVEGMRVKVDRCRISAPFAGRVVKRRTNAFEYVKEGQPLMDVLDDARLRLQTYVPSKWMSWLKQGVPFKVTIDETGKGYQAVVTSLGARVDPASQTVEVWGELQGEVGELLAGMSGSAVFDPSAAPTPAAPMLRR
ncbi:MAG: efflux RND transporter periplasmic adaptor subunit [Magnetococcales bacterium]|nr:efflux RND transporter periplasmic adaptor subunit [Magnetococcales bacterium]